MFEPEYVAHLVTNCGQECAQVTSFFVRQVLHVYTCVALLVRWSTELQKMEFQELVHFLQHLPTTGWSNKEVGELLSQAFVFKTLYHDAPSHLACTT